MSPSPSAPAARGSQHLWHPFADMARVVAGGELVVTRGEGPWVWDDRGRRYLDATAGLWYCNVGHGRADIAAAAAAQMRTLASYQTFDVFANEPALALAKRVCDLAPVAGEAAAFFTSGGSDAVDTAAKIARSFWQLAGQTERTPIVARGGAYHGMNAYGTSLAGIEGNATGWGPLVREVVHIPPHDVAALAQLLDTRGTRSPPSWASRCRGPQAYIPRSRATGSRCRTSAGSTTCC
jgi:putrescine---pyruvate transaminase